jgi:HEAT repeats
MLAAHAKKSAMGTAAMAVVIAMLAAWLWNHRASHNATSGQRTANDAIAAFAPLVDGEQSLSGFAHPRDDLVDDIRRAAADTAYRRMLLERYRKYTDADAKRRLLIVLSAVADDDVRDLALDLASNVDPQKRSDGIELLQSFSLQDPRVRGYALPAIAAERDPGLRSHLLGLFDPAPMPNEDAGRIERLLVTYTTDADAGTRAQALRKLARWNDSDALAIAIIAGLDDPDPGVRQTAIDASHRASADNDRIAASLMAIAADPTRPGEERGTAMAALGRFSLDDEMQANYDAIQASIAP